MQHPVQTVPWVMDKAGVMVIAFGAPFGMNAFIKEQTSQFPLHPRSARRLTGGSVSSHSRHGAEA